MYTGDLRNRFLMPVPDCKDVFVIVIVDFVIFTIVGAAFFVRGALFTFDFETRTPNNVPAASGYGFLFARRCSFVCVSVRPL